MRVNDYSPTASLRTSLNSRNNELSYHAAPILKLSAPALRHDEEVESRLFEEKLQKLIQQPETHIKVQVHEKTKTIMVKIVSDETNVTIREIPSEKMLDFMYDMCLRAGIFIDKRW